MRMGRKHLAHPTEPKFMDVRERRRGIIYWRKGGREGEFKDLLMAAFCLSSRDSPTPFEEEETSSLLKGRGQHDLRRHILYYIT